MNAGARARYLGIQSVMERAGKSGCLFLCLLSIIEERTGKSIDFIFAYRECIRRKWLEPSFYVNDSCAILAYYCHCKSVTRSIVTKAEDDNTPLIVSKNQSVVCRYEGPKGQTHFRLRGYDVLDVTPSFILTSYYVYAFKEE